MKKEERYKFFKSKIDKYRNPNCKQCRGMGLIPTSLLQKNKEAEFKECDCRIKLFRIKKLILANIPKRSYNLLDKKLKKRTVGNLLTGKSVQLYSSVIRRYIMNYKEAVDNGIGMIFFGNPGTGKTVGALYLIIKLLQKGIDCYYIYFKDLMGLLYTTYNFPEKAPLFKEIIGVDVLVVEELSLIGRITPHMVAEFLSICKQRFEDGKPTILISNYSTTEEIEKNFGAPMESLMNEAFIPFRFRGRDLREDKYDYLKKFFT